MQADDRLPRYQRLRDEMVALIAARHWRPGEAIPTEQALAQSYGLAVGTVRKAVDLLVAEGLLERFQGRGTFVRRANFDGSLFRFFRFQTRQGERRIPESRILRREVVDAPSAVAAVLQIPSTARVIEMSRVRLIDGVPMLAEDIWLPYERFEAFAQMDLGEVGDLLYPVYEAQCNQIVASATETLTVEAIGSLHARLLRIKPGTPAVVIERLAYGFDRQPLEWRRSRGPASEFHLSGGDPLAIARDHVAVKAHGNEETACSTGSGKFRRMNAGRSGRASVGGRSIRSTCRCSAW